MRKVFISIPMNGRTDEEVNVDRDKAIKNIKRIYGEDTEIIDSFINEDYPVKVDATHAGVWYLGRSIQLLAAADFAYFCDGWSKYRGCIIEHEICLKYGIEIVSEMNS